MLGALQFDGRNCLIVSCPVVISKKINHQKPNLMGCFHLEIIVVNSHILVDTIVGLNALRICCVAGCVGVDGFYHMIIYIIL